MGWRLKLLWVSTVLAALLIGLLWGRRTSQRALTREVIATMGDHKFYRYDLNRKLKIFERRALELLCYEYMIEQEAQKRKLMPRIKASDSTIEGFETKFQDLLEQIAVYDVPLDYQKQIYQAFSQELKSFTLETAYLGSDAARIALESDLKEGVDFKTAKQKRATEPPGNLPTEELTLFTIGSKYGIEAKKLCQNLGPGQLTEPFPYREGYLVIRVAKLRSSFEELQPDILKIVAESRKVLVLNSMLAKHVVNSKLARPKFYRNPTSAELVDIRPATMPTQTKKGEAAIPNPDTFKYDPSAPTASPGIPKPAPTGVPANILAHPTFTPAPNPPTVTPGHQGETKGD